MKVAIAGYGVEGEANYRYYKDHGYDVTIVDEAAVPGKPIPDGATFLLGPKVFKSLKDYDLVVRTASLPPHHIKTDGKIWSATNEFFAKCPAPIIGVTGTKGKGTTSSLITSILRAAGFTVHLLGNIGQPALDVLHDIKPTDIVVYELSSFQLWDLERSPHVAVVLMIEPDHLDVHADIDDYVHAKGNIRRYQRGDDVCFYHPSNKWSEQIAHSTVLGDSVRYNARDASGVYEEQGYFRVQGDTVCPVSALSLPGAHNVENACAAISAARVFALDNRAIEQGLKVFNGLPHRLKFVAEVKGIRYYDDSIATTPGSAIAALNAFHEPKVIILGGSDKGAHYDEIIRRCKETKTAVVAIGQTGKVIEKLCREHDVVVATPDGDMKNIVKTATAIAAPGGVVLLSPASASFDMFKNYSDRGEQFVAAVNQLAV